MDLGGDEPITREGGCAVWSEGNEGEGDDEV